MGGGPKEKLEEVLKDLTSKSGSRPPIAKASRPITKVSKARQKENVKILKQAEQALQRDEINKPTTGGPGGISVGRREESGSGPGSKFPTEPPDPNKMAEIFLERPNVSSQHSQFGEIG